MHTFKNIATGGLVSALLGAGTASFDITNALAQSGTPSQAPGQSNPQPRPSNPQPGPSNPQPDPSTPQPRPSTPGNSTPTPPPPPAQPDTPQNPDAPGAPGTPAAPGRDDPGAPGQPVQPGSGAPGDPNGVSPNVPRPSSVAGARAMRPFAFQSPELEGRFSESTRRLVVMEERLDKSNADLMKRLGDVRTMAPEKQNAALMDLMQQVLMQQKALHQYLVTARTGWTGDFDMATADIRKPGTSGTPDADGRQTTDVPTDNPRR